MTDVRQPSAISSDQARLDGRNGLSHWIRSGCWTIGCVAGVLLFSGCAIYTPYQVFRFTADYNTDRRPSLQAEVYEHVPPRPVRVRLNRWAYNVGPQPTTAEIPIPGDAPVSPPPVLGIVPGPALVPSVTPGNTIPEDGDLLDESQPPPFPPPPPQPRIDLRSEQPGKQFGPSARANSPIRGVSYSVPQPSVKAAPSPTGAWLFGP